MTWRLLRALDDDWRVLAASAAAAEAQARWADDPVLGVFPDVGSVVEALRSDRYDRKWADRVLGALAARAGDDDVAMRAMLQALLPGLANVATRLGRGTVDDDLEAMVFLEAVARIRGYPPDRPPRAVAANVVLDVFGVLVRQRARNAARAHVGRSAAAEPDLSLEVWELVQDPDSLGRLRPGDAELLLRLAIGADLLRPRAARDVTTDER